MPLLYYLLYTDTSIQVADPETLNTVDRMSVRSATLSLYKSEESLERGANGKRKITKSKKIIHYSRYSYLLAKLFYNIFVNIFLFA